jgi:septal ring factor EnvC (AmiA/AmiB activator)
MFNKSLVLALFVLTIPFAQAGNEDKQIIALLTAANKKLEQRIQSLEAERTRWEKVEKTASSAETAVNQAQSTANSAVSAAARAQATADAAHSSYHNVPHNDLRGHHGGCTPDVSSGANCMAAAHRFCNAVGFTAGLVQEVGPDAYGVACFR